jgi:hypothetical protein
MTMISISSVGSSPQRVEVAVANKLSTVTGSATVAAASDDVSISTLASRLSAAATAINAGTQGLDHDALGSRVQANIQTVLYTFDAEHRAAAAKQVPEPADAASLKSAASATAFLDGKAPNPFAGLSREQLATIANDESGTFTVNERRAAYTQSYQEEEAWREQVVAKASNEYNTTGKMTNFFKEVLTHFNGLPQLEQSLYPENYASDLQAKVDLDFNYFNHSAGDAGPTPGSLATLNQGLLDLLKFPDTHPKAA